MTDTLQVSMDFEPTYSPISRLTPSSIPPSPTITL